MLEKFIYAKEKSLFETALNNGEVLDEAIVFIEDTKEIWNHGTYFDGSKVDLSNIEASILNIIDNYATKTEIPTRVSQLENDVPYALKSDVEVEVEVEAPNGVYAVTADGKLIDYNTADATAIGVALITANQRIMIEKNGEANTDIIKAAYDADDATNTLYQEFNWGMYGSDVAGITNISSSDAAKQDFNGKDNTAAIIATPDTDNNTTYANMGTYCTKFNEMSGIYADWYIPAAGQLYEIYTNVTDINTALTNIGGTTFNTPGYYWSSSENSSFRAWYVYFGNGGVFNSTKDGYDRVRFVRDLTTTTITIKKSLKEKVSELEQSIPTKVSQLENDSDYITKTEVADSYLVKGDYALKSDVKVEVEVEVEVEAPNGVYAVTADDKLIDYNLADTSCIGVAIVAGEHKFMIAKSDAKYGSKYTLYWTKSYSDLSLTNYNKADGTNSSGYLPKPDGTFYDTPHLSSDYTTWTSGALSDFNGKANTAIIAAASSHARDMCSVLNTFNASDSHNDWYVPAFGQLALMYLNMTEINAALAKIGGTALTAGNYWSSSETSSDIAWCVDFIYGYVFNSYKDGFCWVRFIRDLTTITTTIKKSLKEKVIELENNIPTKLSQLENDANYIQDDVIPENGLYIYDTDGRFILPENWNTTNNSKAVGVAILTDDCRFVVAKEDISTNSIRWGGYGTDISTLTNYAYKANAATDFDGVNNTAKIIAAIGNRNDGYRGGTAAGDCAAYTFPNGKTGYLGAAGEWQVARQNKEDLNSALTLIGGTTMKESYYWTSTEYSSGYAWHQYFDSYSDLINLDKRDGIYVRAFLAIEESKSLKEKISELEQSIPTKVGLLENDSDYITKTEVADSYLVKGDYALKSDVEVDVGVEIEVEASNEIYAVTEDGKLIDYNTADESCIGVAFISDNQKVMIAKADATEGTYKTLYWGKNLYRQDVPNLENLVDATAAKADYNGKANTSAIIAGYAALGKDMNSRDMCKILETFNEGGYTDWYVPAAGQLYEFYSNKAAINKALAAINGKKFNTTYYYNSSSEESADYAWDVSFIHGDVGNNNKDSGNCVRFVRDLTIKKSLKEKVIELESKIGDINAALDYIINGPKLITFTIDSVEYQAEEGMTWLDWVNSEYNTIMLSISDTKITNGSKYISLTTAVNNEFVDKNETIESVNYYLTAAIPE